MHTIFLNGAIEGCDGVKSMGLLGIYDLKVNIFIDFLKLHLLSINSRAVVA